MVGGGPVRSGWRSEHSNTLYVMLYIPSQSLTELIQNEAEEKGIRIWVNREGVMNLGGDLAKG